MIAPHLDDDDVPAVTYDLNDDSVVVIIGSGAGGGTIADELTRRGIDVVVLEAGPRFKMSDFVNDEWAMYDRLTWKDTRACTGASPIARDYPTAPTWTCKGLGGTTLHWAAMCPRPRPYEFKVRTTYGDVDGAALEDWPVDFDEMEPFLREAESKMGVTGRGDIPLQRGSNNYRVMALGAKRMGYRDYGPNNCGHQRGAPRRSQRLRSDRLLHAGLQVRRQVVHLRLRAAPRRGDRPLRDSHPLHGAPHRA